MAALPDPLSWRSLSDEQMWRQCRWEAFRGSGPGGQKRNKTSSAVRVVHEPTGLAAVAGESRSQAENRARAFRRLRRAIAFGIRQPLDLASFDPPAWFVQLLQSGDRLDLSPRHALFLAAGGLALDVLAAAGGSVADATRVLGLTTGNLVAFLASDDVLWEHANRIRASRGLKNLRRV